MHAVQYYEDEAFLVETVALFLQGGLNAGDVVVIIATPKRAEAIVGQLEPSARERALAAGELVVLDAEAMLGCFMVGGSPSEALFEEAIDRVWNNLPGPAGVHVRAFGEMVNVLWRQGNATGAVQLEEIWNRAARRRNFSLLCAYAMSNFYKQDEAAQFRHVCATHTHVLPTEKFSLENGDGFERLREISMLEHRARLLHSEVNYREEIEGALRASLGERLRVEQELRASIQREHEARVNARASDTYREVLLRLLDPLNTLLATTRLMATADEGALGRSRLDRLTAVGSRVQHALEGILQVAREGLTENLALTDPEPCDVAMVAARVVQETRTANPGVRFELTAVPPCFAPVDADRLKQALSHLLRNATHHSDRTRPVEVQVREHDVGLNIRVRYAGPPVDSGELSALFTPSNQPRSASTDGLSTDLYVAERIVAAHGGRIDVTSSLESGTTFDVWLPVTTS
jgi:signal transduction histidine kinase